MKTPLELEQPNRIVKIHAIYLAQSIEAVRELGDLLAEIKGTDVHYAVNRINELHLLWDQLSEAIEE